MACHGTLDVVVHLHRFRNVDLFSRGIYMIRVSAESKSSQQTGIPYSYYSKPSTQSTFVRNQEIPCGHAKTLPTAQIVNETSEFSTRAFVIKYRDERLELNEGVQFQLLIEAKAEGGDGDARRLVFENGEPINIKLELLMAELEKPSEEGATSFRGSTVAQEKPSATPTFARIASQTLCVVCDAASQQLHAYFPATFSAMHFCQLDLTVHVALINLKYRKRAYSRTEEAKLGSGARVAKPVTTFDQLLFPGHAPDEPVDPASARATHHTYLQPMLQSLGATAAALRTMCAADDTLLENGASPVPSSRAVAGVMALIKKPYLEQTSFNDLNAAGGGDNELTPVRVANSVETDVKLVARRLFLLWGRFVALLPQEQLSKSKTSVSSRLQRTWLASQRRWWGSRLQTQNMRIQKILQPATDAAMDASFRELRARSRSAQQHPRSMLNIFDENMLGDPSLLPVCASHVFLRREASQPTRVEASPVQCGIPALAADEEFRGPHLIVMQHGWYASSFDMRLLRGYALLLFPNAIVLSPQSNEDNSGGSMGPMGARLAHEIHNFIKHRCDELLDADPGMGRITFFGHSAGSMIVRTALMSPVLKPYLPKMHAFVSLSSSHCGNMFVPSTIISGGMWALQHLHASQFMDELQLIDAGTMTDSFMYKLSDAPGFEFFRYVVLVGSQQDCYVPMHTAQATIPRPAETASGGDGSAYMQMATNLMKPLSSKQADAPKQTTVVRLTMEYKFTQTNLDTVIGRAAHLAYIDSPSAVLLILYSLYNLLK